MKKAKTVSKAKDENAEPGWRERRDAARYAADADTVLLVLGHGIEFTGRIEDLSLTGCKVETEEPSSAAIGRVVEIAFHVNRQGLRLAGIVQWSDGRKLGVRFEPMSDRRRDDLAEVIADLAQNAVGQPPPQNGDGEPVPWSESPTPSKQLRKVAAINEEESGDLPPGWERRRAPRQKTALMAALYRVGRIAKQNGKVLDLSLTGCRIGLEKPFKGEPSIAVEAGFYHLGLPFRVAGVVRVLHSPTEVGIEFEDVSPRNLEKLAGLMEELKEELHG